MSRAPAATPSIRHVATDCLRYRLAKPVGGSGVAQVDVLVTDVTLSNDVRGLGFSYVIGGGGEAACVAARQLAAARLAGQPLHHPEASWQRLAGALNRTRRGPNYIALAALDVALWDAYANALGVPLGVAMGGAPRRMRVYGSGDFSPQHSPAEAAALARGYVERGLAGVKPRVSCKPADTALMRAVVDAVGAMADVMVDANEKGSATSAARLVAAAREAGVLWVEEPLPADDAAGYRALGAAFPGLVATGEHLQGTSEMLALIAERSVGVIQPDLAMAGGLTETLRIARIAGAFGVEVAPHFLPGLFVHAACASPAITWLEEFPLVEPLFTGWPALGADGTLALREDASGHGLALAHGARAAYLLKVDA
jgi:L-alanine-DL-glutamate epimerase-like enolase superfamily enzyme